MKISASSVVRKVKREYPYFGKLRENGLVVLFIGPKTGLMVDGPPRQKLYSDNWNEEIFFPVAYTATFTTED